MTLDILSSNLMPFRHFLLETEPFIIENDHVIIIVEQLCDAVPTDEQMYRCEHCDELFTSKLELRRHQKYSCSSSNSIFDSLSEDFKQEHEDSDEPVHECKDCEKLFPSEYRSAHSTTPHNF